MSRPGIRLKADKLKEVCLKSADDMLSFCEIFGAGESVIGVRRYVLSGKGHLVLSLESPVTDTSGIYLRVGDDVFDSSCIVFPFCDPRSKTLGVLFTQGNTEAIFEGHPDIEVVVDLSFLVRKTRDYYAAYGDLIRYPDFSPSFVPEEYPFPRGREPTEQQRSAVSTVLNNSMTYIWGAPGTGKTQLVLATAIMAYVRRKRRVAIIAPTNNAVEQVLRGLITAIEADPGYRADIDLERDIARIGSPTPSFVRDYPSLCEAGAAEALRKNQAKEREVLRKVLIERRLDRARPHFLDCISLLEMGDRDGAEGEARIITDLLGDDPRLKKTVSFLESLDIDGMRESFRRFYSRDRPLKDID